MTATDTVAYVNGDIRLFNQFLDKGTILIDSEYMSYTSKALYLFDTNVFTLSGLTRGINGTTATTHSVGATVTSQSSAIQVSVSQFVSLTGNNLASATGSVITRADANVVLTRVTLTAVTGYVSIAIGANVSVTGNQLTASTGKLFTVAWAVVDINTTNTWTTVNTNTTSNWRVVDIAA
jgi:hypothetical protein